MSWRLRLSVETILRLTPAVLGSTVFSIAGLCAAHACLDDQALLAAREAIGSSLQTSEFRGWLHDCLPRCGQALSRVLRRDR